MQNVAAVSVALELGQITLHSPSTTTTPKETPFMLSSDMLGFFLSLTQTFLMLTNLYES